MCNKPTIEDIERIMDGNALPVKILPNGELTMDYEHCAHRNKCRASDNKESAPSASDNTAMLQLLSDIKEIFDKVGFVMMTKNSEMYRRIDAVIAQLQHG